MPRERALGEFVRQQLRPLSARDDVTRYIHILNWEAVRPTAVYRKLVSEEAAPFLGFAVDLMRRFMPDADRRTLIMAAVWLVGQCNVFIRYREQLAMPPVSLNLDEPGGRPAFSSYQRVGASRTCAGKRPRLAVLTAEATKTRKMAFVAVTSPARASA